MTEAAAATTTTTSGPEELARLAVESLQHVRLDRQTAGSMSRRRFICIQTNSILLGLITLLTVAILALYRLMNDKEFLFGDCGIVSQLLARNNLTTFHNCSSTVFS